MSPLLLMIYRQVVIITVVYKSIAGTGVEILEQIQ